MTTEAIKVRFTCKPADLDCVLSHGASSAPADEIEIELRKELTETEYDEFASTMLEDRDWLAGRGGHLNHHTRRVIEVTAPHRTTLFVDPSGYRYGRYVGVAIEAPSTINDQASAIRWLLHHRQPDISIEQALRTLRLAISGDRVAVKLLDQIAAEV